MTGDEVAAAVYAERGFVVLGSNYPMPIGYLTRDNSTHKAFNRAQAPLKVIAESNLDEFLEQCECIERLLGISPNRVFPWTYFYRVEAAD